MPKMDEVALAGLESAARYMTRYESGLPMSPRSARVYRFAAMQVRATIEEFEHIDELVFLSETYPVLRQELEQADLGRSIAFYRKHACPELEACLATAMAK